jgi:hypothetical protein
VDSDHPSSSSDYYLMDRRIKMVMSSSVTGNRLSDEKRKPMPRGFVTLLFLAGLLSACAPMSKNVVKEGATSHVAIQNATTLRDHHALAKHFEDAAREMRAKAEEQKALLQQYENGNLYGWQSHSLKSNALALIRKYEQAAQSKMKEAISHRQMAQKLEENYVGHGSVRRDSAFLEK